MAAKNVQKLKHAPVKPQVKPMPIPQPKQATAAGPQCYHCSMNDLRVRKREFSEQAWSTLVVWGQIDKSLIDQPICDVCYDELREVLIDFSEASERGEAPPAPIHIVNQPKKQASASGTKKSAPAAAAKKPVKKSSRMAS